MIFCHKFILILTEIVSHRSLTKLEDTAFSSILVIGIVFAQINENLNDCHSNAMKCKLFEENLNYNSISFVWSG